MEQKSGTVWPETAPRERASGGSRHPLSERFHQVLRELGALHDRKQADYGQPHDPFANVRGSQEWGLEPWVGAMVRAQDKMRRLQKVAKGGTLSNESAEDSFKDLAVYTIIASILYEETHACPTPPDAAPEPRSCSSRSI